MPASKKATSVKSESKKMAADAKSQTRKAVAPAAARTATATTAKPKAAANAAKPRRAPAPRIDPDKRRCYVEVAAYYIAERRGFGTGDQARDWLAAEEEIDRLLQENKLTV